MDLEILGIALGFFAALCQAANYAFAKDCVEKYQLKGIRQVVSVHVLMFCMVILPFIYFQYYKLIDIRIILHVIVICGTYLIGQYLSVKVLTLTDSSVVAPLLNLKLPVLAMFSVLFLNGSFSMLQIFSITLIICLGFYFSSLSGKIEIKPLLIVFGICIAYCTSDITMTKMMPLFNVSKPHQICAGICYEYLGCALFALPLMQLRSLDVKLKHVWNVKWVGCAWMGSMIGIVSCFNLAGVVEANVIQSLRSVLGIIIAYLFYQQYIHDHGTFRKKMVIAILMFLSVGLYYIKF